MKFRFLFCVGVILLLGACTQPVKPPAVNGGKPADTLAAPPKPSTSQADAGAVKRALLDLLELAKAGDCAGLAPSIALRVGTGDDVWHRGLRYEVEEEKLEADKECAMLQVIVTGLQETRFLEFTTVDEREGEWLVWNVELKYADGTVEQKAFAFLNANGLYLLGDID